MPKPTDVVVWGQTMSGKPARMGARTAAHLDVTIARLERQHPGCTLHLIQSAYNTGVGASAGTHDKDGVLDVWIEGMGWWEQQAFLRACGWAAWYRFPPAFGRHIHMISLGCPGPVGEFVPGQVRDYYAHRTGLAGHASDPSWHPADINQTIFDYPAWLAEKENDMTKEELASAPIKMLIGPENKVKEVTLQNVLRDLEGTQDMHGKRLQTIETKLDEILKLLAKPAAARPTTTKAAGK